MPDTSSENNAEKYIPKTLPISSSTDQKIQDLLKEFSISLTVDEAKKVANLLNHDPTVIEAVIWGIQGSEHCSYKSSKQYLRQFPTTGKHIILGPVEDSGIVAITDGPVGERWGFVVTHESHNHPSQIVPYEGAATGVGGTVRDVICMGARVIGCMDMLRLGDLKTDESKTIAKEVVRGIGGYGNPLGIPNLGGDTVFDSSYNSNCLVNAIALGIIKEDEIIHSYVPEEAAEIGYDIILVGKPTDRSGFGGASFASASMEEDEQKQNTGAVQEPNPFLERHLLASCYALFDWLVAEGKLHKISCKDLGAGGVVCASVEQVADKGFGADVYLDNVHVALDGLPPEVIGCAETQERLCFTCHPDLTERIVAHFNEDWDLPNIAENARASVIGKVTKENIYRLYYKGAIVCEAKALDITCGLSYERPVAPKQSEFTEPEIVENSSFNITIDSKQFSLKELCSLMLKDKNATSKADVYRRFDKNVIGNSILEPGEADASVIAPLQNLKSYMHQQEHPGWELSESDKWKGVAVSADGNGRYGRISPYWQGVNATVEAMLNVAAVGSTPRALTDCLNYGNPEIPEQMWELAEGTKGIADTAKNVELDGEPVAIISGNVSLYNSKPDGSSIDPTAIVSCIGILSDARKAVSMQLKKADSHIFIIGERKDELGGSLMYQMLEEQTNSKRNSLIGKNIPKPDFKYVAKLIEVITKAISKEIILSSHDISDGGLLLSLIEMTFPQRKLGGNIGLQINLDKLNSELPTWKLLFSETSGFVVEVDSSNCEELNQIAKENGVFIEEIGRTSKDNDFSISYNGESIISENIKELHTTWANGLRNCWK